MCQQTLQSGFLINSIGRRIFTLFLGIVSFVCLAESPPVTSNTPQTCERKTLAAAGCLACKIELGIELGADFSSIKKTGQALQFEKLSTRVLYIIQSMSDIARCPDRIWPDLRLTEEPYIVLDKSKDTATVVTHDSCGNPSYRSPSDSEVTRDYFESKNPFEFTSINDKRRVIIKWSENKEDFLFPITATEAFSLLVHEAFHACDQSHEHWKKDDLKIDRFSQKTEECTPRKYRAYIRYYLEKALKKNVNSRGYKKALRKAAWWNKKYKENFPEEVKAAEAADIIEGSAEFVTIRANALLQEGCQASEEELQKAYSKHYFNNRGKYPKILSTPDFEAYNIGSLASALLENSSSPQWQKKVTEGTSPVQLLLEEVSPRKTTRKVREIEDGCRVFESGKKHREFSVQNINNQLQSENYIALSITHTQETRKGGTFALRGSASSGLEGYEQAYLDASMKIDTGSSHITLKDVHLLSPEITLNECGIFQGVVLIPESAISEEEGNSAYTIDLSKKKDTISNMTGKKEKLQSSLKGKVTVTEKIEQKGADIWCAK